MNDSLPRSIRSIVLVVAILPIFALSAAAQNYSATIANEAPPSALSADVRATLDAQAIQVKGPQGVLCEIWLRKSIPTVASPAMALGVVYAKLAPGTLVGAIRFPAQAIDFRNQQVKPGVYTLRYELNPVDGNHQGVAPQRDFLLLGPATADTATAALDFEHLVDLSDQTTGLGHPSVWSMMPADSAPAQLPAVTSQDSDNGPVQVLYFQTHLGTGKPTTIGLVVVGTSATA